MLGKGAKNAVNDSKGPSDSFTVLSKRGVVDEHRALLAKKMDCRPGHDSALLILVFADLDERKLIKFAQLGKLRIQSPGQVHFVRARLGLPARKRGASSEERNDQADPSW